MTSTWKTVFSLCICTCLRYCNGMFNWSYDQTNSLNAFRRHKFTQTDPIPEQCW